VSSTIEKSDVQTGALDEGFDEVRYVVGVTSPEWADGDEDEAAGSDTVVTTWRNGNRMQGHSR
jgi:hypothetical protein